jgi:hypothetical protein
MTYGVAVVVLAVSTAAVAVLAKKVRKYTHSIILTLLLVFTPTFYINGAKYVPLSKESLQYKTSSQSIQRFSDCEMTQQ